jgi:hypothetical protein
MLEAGETQTNEPVSGSCTRRILTKKNAGNDDIVIRISRSTIAAKSRRISACGAQRHHAAGCLSFVCCVERLAEAALYAIAKHFYTRFKSCAC